VATQRHHSEHTATLGGRRLQALRKQAGKTQLIVEADAELGSGYMQRIESGKVQQPERATLERILAALDASYSERRDILALFGYLIHTPLPTDAEVVWARAASHEDLHTVPFPAYVLDCGHRLLAWNRYVPKLMPILAGESTDRYMEPGSIFRLWFDPRYHVTQRVHNAEIFLAQVVRALRHEMELFGGEPWYHALIDQLVHDLPLFRRYWERGNETGGTASAARALVPVHLLTPDGGLLQFRISAEPFTHDARFRVVYFLPADPFSIRQCAAWASLS
jgi:transcriptional regulator with XRE-family HTH domain